MAALGVEEGRRVLDLVRTMRERGVSVIVISHNLEHVFQLADRIAIMKNGRLIDVVETAADHARRGGPADHLRPGAPH